MIYIIYKNFRYYYKYDSQRLSACRISFHYLLHVTDCIKYCGPCWSYWQFPMERLCGMLLPLVKSKTNPYSNLANNITLLEQFFHLPYFNISKSIFHTKIEKEWNTNLVYGNIEGYEEEFYWPSTNFTLSRIQINQLTKYYKGYNIPQSSLSVSKLILLNFYN